jgi:hypothetical protein
MDKGHTTAGYIFDFLTIEHNTGASPEAVDQALEALDKFSTLSIADPMIRNWIHSVREDVVLMIGTYEIKLISLSWGSQFLHAEVSDLLHCPNPGCQVMVFDTQWEEKKWMTSCNWRCWWRHEHRNFVWKFRGGFMRMYFPSAIYY